MTDYYNDNDPFAAQWLRNLIKAGLLPSGDVDERSIIDVRGGDLRGYRRVHFFAGIGGWAHALELAGWPEDDEVWTGSCPCQPLSVAGQQRGHVDERHLWPAFYRLIAERRPAKLFGEQVASKDGLEWLAGVRADLEAAGYAIGAAIIPACSIGAPHRRERLFFVGDAAHGQQQERQGDGSPQRGRTILAAGVGAASANHVRGGDVADAAVSGSLDTLDGSVSREGMEPEQSAGRGGAVADAAGQGAKRDIREEGGARRACGAEPSQCGRCDAWDGAIWLAGADGKARRVKSGLRLLVDELPRGLGTCSAEFQRCAELAGLDGKSLARAKSYRVGSLRGYGNAIIAPLAAEFVKAFLECRQ